MTGRFIAGGVTCRLDGSKWTLRLFVAVWNAISRLKKWCAGSFIFCEAAAFREVGGFSSELFVSEELDLSQKLKALARKRGKRMVILTRQPLLTSARKVDLYGHLTHLKFLLKLMLGPKRTIRTREECAIWYDGRR